MIEESALVVALEGNDLAWLETQRQSACGQCAVNKGCGTGSIAQLLGKRYTRVLALNQAGAVVGDRVIVGVPEQALVRGALWVYMLPLLGLLLGAVVGRQWAAGVSSGEAASILCGIAGLALGFWAVRRHARRTVRDSRYQPIVLRRAAGESGPVAVPMVSRG